MFKKKKKKTETVRLLFDILSNLRHHKLPNGGIGGLDEAAKVFAPIQKLRQRWRLPVS